MSKKELSDVLENQLILIDHTYYYLDFNNEPFLIDVTSGKQSTDLTKDENGEKWTYEGTKFFISTYAEKKDHVEKRINKTQKKMWKKIKMEMDKKEYKFTTIQIKNKWKSLERGHKKMLENKTKTGRGRKNCPFERY